MSDTERPYVIRESEGRRELDTAIHQLVVNQTKLTALFESHETICLDRHRRIDSTLEKIDSKFDKSVDFFSKILISAAAAIITGLGSILVTLLIK